MHHVKLIWLLSTVEHSVSVCGQVRDTQSVFHGLKSKIMDCAIAYNGLHEETAFSSRTSLDWDLQSQDIAVEGLTSGTEKITGKKVTDFCLKILKHWTCTIVSKGKRLCMVPWYAFCKHIFELIQPVPINIVLGEVTDFSQKWVRLADQIL